MAAKDPRIRQRCHPLHDGERGPDDDLQLVFESASRLDDEGKQLLKALIEGVILRQETRRISVEAS